MKLVYFKTLILCLGLLLSVSTLHAQIPSNCLAFDGANDVVNCGLQNPSTFTVEAWVNPYIINSDKAVVSTLTIYLNTGMEIHLALNKAYLTIRSGGSWIDLGTTTTLEVGKWVHLAASYDGATAKIYVNGVLSNSVSVSSYTPSSSGNPFFIGQRNSGGSNFSGRIDEVRHWNIARTQEQIQQNMNNELAGTESGLLSYYKFNQSSGTTLTDTKGSYNGTLVGFTLSGQTSNYAYHSLTLTPKTYYVNASAAAGGNGSLAAPWNSFSSFLTLYLEKYDTIKVAVGTYSLASTFELGYNDVVLMGGYNNSFTTRNPATTPSIIQPAAGNNAVLMTLPCTSAKIDGFTFQNANNTTTIYGYSQSRGGAILITGECGYTYTTRPTITNCYFTNNKSAYGAGIHISAANTYTVTEISNCTFTGNSTTSDGGAIDSYNGNTNISNCTFFGNSVTNNATIRCVYGVMNLYHNTIVGNTATNNCAGVSISSGGTLNMAGNIIAGNYSGTSAQPNDVWLQAGTINDLGYNLYGATGGNQAGSFTIASTSQWVPTDYLDDVLETTTTPTTRLFPAKVAYNGGFTPTIKVIGEVFGNSAGQVRNIKNVPASLSLTSDQRGVTRLTDFATIGAYEYATTPNTKKVIYVNKLSAGGDGLTPQTALNDLQIAMVLAKNDTIKVAAGVYTQAAASWPFQNYSNRNLILYGNYNDKFTARDTDENRTTLKGISGALTSILYVVDGNLTIDGFTFTGGIADGTCWGGAIHYDNINTVNGLKINNCIFDGNKTTGGRGGAVWINSNFATTTATITNSIFRNNSAAASASYSGDGGAIYTNNVITGISSCIFYKNSSTNDGGAINKIGTPFISIQNSTFTYNSSTYNGSAVELNFTGSASITNSTFFANSVTSTTNGTGTVHSNAILAFNSNTMLGNSCVIACGGLSNGLGTLNMAGNIIAGNTGGSYCGGAYDIWKQAGTINDLGYNLFTAAGVFTMNANSRWVTNAELARVLETTATPPASGLFTAKVFTNGGFTPTVKVIGRALNGRLADNVTAAVINIRTVPSSYSLSTDQRGVTRKTGNATMGAYEYDASAADGTSIYVRESLNATGTGTKANPYNTLYYAISAALPGDTIKVAAGTYYNPSTGSIGLKDNLTLLGGYKSDFSIQDPRLYPSVLKTQLPKTDVPVIYVDPSNSISLSTINGFTIQDAANTYNGSIGGGGIHFESNVLTRLNISNCTFNNNRSTSGGAIYIASTSSTAKVYISNCSFFGNAATSGTGGAIYFGGNLEAFLTNNTIYANTATSFGGGIYTGSGKTHFISNTIVGNYCNVGNGGGGIEMHGTMDLQGNIIAGNRSLTGSSCNEFYKNSTVLTDNGYNIFGQGGIQSFPTNAKSLVVPVGQLYRILERKIDLTDTTNQQFYANIADNGGPTPSIRLIGKKINPGTGDVAVNVMPATVGTTTMPTTDQRGYNRIAGAACYGAYDFNAWSGAIYVNINAPAGGNGYTPATALNDLNYAMSVAAITNDTIKVAAGAYTTPAAGSPFNISKNMTLLGGYNSTFSSRNAATNLTTLNGFTGTVVAVIYAPNVNLTIDGFTITGGKNDNNTNASADVNNSGGGINYILSGTKAYELKISNCIFSSNTGKYGGAIGLKSSSTGMAVVTISSCTFLSNTSTMDASAIYSTNKFTITATNNTFYNNTVSSGTGTIKVLTGTTLNFYNNTVVGNNATSSYSGGLSNDGATVNMAGNIIAGNKSSTGTYKIHDVWNQSGTLNDLGYNIIGENGAAITNATTLFTLNSNSKYVTPNQLYRILESANTTAFYTITERQFVAQLTNNGGATSTIKLIGKYLKNTTGTAADSLTYVRSVPLTVNAGSVTMPTTDQRGESRTSGSACMGAIEINASDKNVYVNIAAATNGNGSLLKPFNDIAPAFPVAANGDTIKIVGGIYSLPASGASLEISKNIVVMGGYNASFTEFDPAKYLTTIDYNTGTLPLIKILNTSAEINGLKIRNAQSTTLGGGLFVEITDNNAYNIKVKNCYFADNHASNGAAICLNSTSSSVLAAINISNTTFTGGISTAKAGAVYANGRFNTVISNCTFYNNTAGTNGGAVWQGQYGSMQLIQNTIVGNKCTLASAGGGVTTTNGTIGIEGNIISGNYSGTTYHDVFQESGTITDNGQNILGTGGVSPSSINAATTSISVATSEMYNFLKCDSTKTYTDRQFYAIVADNGGFTPTIKLKKKVVNTSVPINVVLAQLGGNTMTTADQRGVNRIIGSSCIGAYELRDTAQTHGIINDVLTSSEAHLHFTPGSFTKRLIFVKNGSYTSVVPVNNTNYAFNNEFGKEGQIGTSGWYCVYNGSDTVVNITGLLPVETYQVVAFEYNSTSSYYTKLTGVVKNPISFTTPQKVQTISFTLTDKTYGDSDFNLTDTTSLGLKPVIYTSSNLLVATIVHDTTVHIVGVGNATITANHAGNTKIGAATPVMKSLAVSKAPLTIIANNTTSAYGEKPDFDFTATGLKNNDSIIAKYGVTYTSEIKDKDTCKVGNYYVTPSAAVFAANRGNANNYNITYSQDIHTVIPSELTIKAGNKTKYYGSMNPGFTFEATGLKHADKVDSIKFSTLAKDTSSVGNYDIIPSGLYFAVGHASNYTIKPYINGTLSIIPAEVKVIAENKNKIFGEHNPAFTYYVTGLISTDKIDSVALTADVNDSSDVNSYNIYPTHAIFTSGKASNYAVQYLNGKLTIDSALVTVKTSDTSKIYGTANPIFKYKVTGLKFADAIDSVKFTTSAVDASSVNSYVVTPSSAIMVKGEKYNYKFVYADGQMVVKPATLTITAKDTSKMYGGANPTSYNYSVDGLKFSDKMGSVSYATNALQSSKVGTYNIVPSAATLSIGTGNYTFIYIDGKLLVAKAALNVTADNKTKVYGSKNPAFTFASTGLKLSDSIATVGYTCNADSASKVGTYNIIPANATFKTAVAENYTVTYTNGSLSVTQVPLTIKAEDKTKAYFTASNPVFTASYSGFVNGETASVLTTQPLASCSAVKTSKAGTYPIAFSGAKAENYSISYLPGSLTVTESPIQLCLVTVDLETGKNMVIWQRNKDLGIAKYKVYRETSVADEYKVLDSVPFAKVGVYVDLTSKPQNEQNRYKISAVDSSGNESVLSHYHQNVFMQYNNSVNGINLSWKPYEIEGGTMEFKSYVLYRGADSAKLDSFNTLSANATVYIDTDPLSTSKLMFYRIGGILKNACNTNTLLKAGGGVYVQAISNMEDNRLRSSSVSGLISNMSMSVYPQPASDFINVTYALEKPGQVTFEILNIMGESVATVDAGQVGSELSTSTLDINQYNLQNGIYYLKLKTKYQTGIKKFIVTK